ncbi:hypothetical protein WMY93_009171 [Mugilogobius chulae]|uniref:Gypsy retrotransposon integrase-like protein 1 n=1 Tax=Mugilogobius chulae TaxID=88201 RepID=A0AAW0PH86_9GOBI
MAGRRKRKGLRSQRKFEEDDEDLAGTSVHELSGAAVQPIHELVGLMKDFMSSQKEREEGLLEEIRNLRGTHRSPSPSARSAQGSSSVGSPSPRLALPTPVAPRRPQGESTALHRPLAEESGHPDFAPPSEWRPYAVEPKIPPYQTGEDIENYLLRFERIAKTWKWPETEWACRLVPLLSGKALEAYTAMDEDEAHCYRDLKAALLVKFDVSPETYRQRFRSTIVPSRETPTETYHRLKSLYRRWVRPDQLTKEQIGELIILEQLLHVLPSDVRTWVKEHEPEDGLTAARLALQYQNARRGGPPRFSSAPRPFHQPAPARPNRETNQDTRGTPSSATTQQAPGKPIVCYYCQQPGHKASVCPVRRDKLTGACYAPRVEELVTTQSLKERTMKIVTLNGQQTARNAGSTYTSLAGHFGRHKTYLRVSARFYWPRMYQDIQAYCTTCPICQKTAPTRKSDRALLHPLPVISTPFRRIAMDIVGPLVKSARGHQYILVVCDYATRYPEAFPLRTITAHAVLRVLIQLFSRVGIPDETLTDQGTNFTSRLLQLFHKQLGITALRTTPYHPQTDGLVERFNQTLKRMLQKFVSDTRKDWDRWLPFVLFAYREVPQSSTGFSPFELLYGWDVQGPLDLLSKAWTTTESKASEQGIVQYVLQMRDRLAGYRDEAEENLKEAQRKQKTWYDQQARQRDFQPGQKVLLLLPSSNSKLLAKWQGPYTISRRMGPVTYEILQPEKKKPRQTYHVNLLKEWKETPAVAPKAALLVRRVEVEEEEDPGVPVVTKASEPLVAHLSADQAADLLGVFKDMPSLFTAEPGKTTLIEHVIRLKDKNPIRQRPYRVPQQLVAQLRQEIESMLELGVIEPSTSEWCSPVVIVFKKDGSLRICIDFRKLNSISEFDAYPMPRIDDLLDRIGSAAYITTLDLCKGYWQVPLEKSSRPYTAFRTPAGLFQFTVMPFGLHGAPATFQRLMDKVLQGCEDFSAAYLDDVVIFSRTWEEHVQHLRSVLEKIQVAGLTLNVAKCEWARRETRYLGYQLGRGEVRPQMDKVEAIQKCPCPRTKKEVRSFLGLAGWYRRFVPQFATIAAPLTALTTKDKKNPVTWTDECEAAFNTLKTLLCSSPVLRSPDFSRRFLVQVDASEVGLGAVLTQGESDAQQPILYLSRKLLPRESRYSVVEKEGLAIKWALESLKYYLLGREFDLETDHRALTWINSMKDHNSRLTRWYLSLQPFKFVVRHRSGRSNLVADYLSRLPRLCQPSGGGGWCDGAGPDKAAAPSQT